MAPYPLKNFSKSKISCELPKLVEIQLNSYDWFCKQGLRELFDEVSPIKDWSGKEIELYFQEYYFDEPKTTEVEAKILNSSYEAPLRCNLKLVNKQTNKTKEQEIYLGDFPMMTERGTFIINGVERVVVSQLIRSSGIFFTLTHSRAGKRFFGAKVIPNRGAWLEFETDNDGVISVKIDRKRKVSATTLLKAFGMEDEETIKKTFADVDKNEEVKFIEATLAKDAAKTQGEAFIEIYRRLRPGDLAAIDNAKQLIEAMFFNFERYDLSKVGRWKLNQRLGIDKPITKENRVFSLDDLVLILKEIINLSNNPEAVPDDIDHLANRRVRTNGELLQNKLRVGMARMERIIRDRMSILETETLMPSQLINARPFIASVKEFFTTSQLSQFMDQVNPLSELEHRRLVSTMGPGGLTRERAGFEVRDVHSTYYGRICPIQTPEGPNIGLVGRLSTYARLNEHGFIETPYRKVENGQVSEKIEYLDAFKEQKVNIAHAGVDLDDKKRFTDSRVEARVKGHPSITRKEKIDYMDVSSQQCISVATSLIPFLEHDDANRALMGSNMQRQAVPCVWPQAPLVGTGMEGRAAFDSGQLIIAREDGVVKASSSDRIEVQETKSGKTRVYNLHAFMRTNQFTSVSQRPLARKGQIVKKGDVLADGTATEGGYLALGQNLLCAFVPWRGANFEDAIILSEKVVRDDRFTSIHIEDFSCDIRETKLGPEITTPDIPNVGEEKLKDLDEEGIVRVGAEVGPGDILVGKISPKGEADLTAEERLLRAIFGEKARDVKDTSLRLPHGKRGRVVGIHIFSRDKGDKLQAGVIKSIRIEVAQLRPVMVGDKLAGRHGNKGVIARVLPQEEMPYLPDGTPVEVILNPLGVASRMNIGQILETHLGWAAKKLTYRAACPALDGPTEETIKAELKKAGLPEDGKVELYDGRTGEPFGQKVTVGYIYILKLNHLVEDKIHMRSIGPYSLITQQPLGGKAQFGGQRFGEMEVWALEGYGAAHTLQEMLTIKSDDVAGRANAYDSIIRGHKIRAPHIPASFDVLVSELKALGLNVELAESDLKIQEDKEREARRREEEIG
jgi:DNA-directed RNA polymerase subunit beta